MNAIGQTCWQPIPFLTESFQNLVWIAFVVKQFDDTRIVLGSWADVWSVLKAMPKRHKFKDRTCADFLCPRKLKANKTLTKMKLKAHCMKFDKCLMWDWDVCSAVQICLIRSSMACQQICFQQFVLSSSVACPTGTHRPERRLCPTKGTSSLQCSRPSR